MRSIAIMASIGIALALAGCGGGGGGGSSSRTVLTYKEVDLTTGVITARLNSYDPKTAAATAMVFRQVPASDTVPAFWIAIYECTQAQWQALSGVSQATIPAAGLDASALVADKPAFALRFDSVLAALSTYGTAHGAASATPHSLALPSDEQWQRAAAANSTDSFSWGASTDPTTATTYAVVRETRTAVGPARVGSRAANGFGLYDMAGNVWELVDDGSTPGAAVRGGSWNDNLDSARLDVSREIRTDTAHALVGARLVLVLP